MQEPHLQRDRRSPQVERLPDLPLLPVPQVNLLPVLAGRHVVEVPFVVIWRIQDAEKYLFRIQNPESTVKDVAESAMREVVGESDFERILTTELGQVRTAVQKLMQETLDSYESGIVIDEVSLQRVFPPSTVADAFRDVQAAKIDLETFFARAPRMNPNTSLITGVVCGVRVEDIADPLMQKIRYLDKLVDELARGKQMSSILRAG